MLLKRKLLIVFLIRELALTQKMKMLKAEQSYINTPEIKKKKKKWQEHVPSNILLSYATFTMNKVSSTICYSYHHHNQLECSNRL